MNALLEVEDLKTYFSSRTGLIKAVDGVSFSIQVGQTVCLVGESGSGKSMSAWSIMGLIRPPGKIVGGKILFKGQNLLAYSDKQMQRLRGREIGMVFQEPMTSLNPSYTIGFQISEVFKIHQSKLSSAQIKQKSLELLNSVGLDASKYNAYPFKLSGGQRQRVVIAMAMACKPSLLIADEPTTALDVTIQAQILELMQDLQKQQHMAMLFITHDLGVVAQFADVVVVLYKGEVVEKARASDLFNNPKHPYTQALLEAIPKPGKRKVRLKSVDENTNYLDFAREIRC
ncbi:ABC transporter ATP-binding protein [Helicobacter suis]|uniref:Dipeptide ABC transporter, ATP-binding protein DppD n=1 Tax=Helicobacter suis TaxID=104628 RepID=A0A6J4D0E9_9HELI|nr:ABC transporter ATP-binding protein [Helicobacter suis]BCD45645.1 Dipeptide ABC transporter, ATP-binding protein DppD [Helicobacter suis]BCD47345.1 Dipeptide ABC transporter, ATP-binding protein DppD [Helicobacter suis]BCD49098.1 Dipeptide ABC transporter, ATP-binding protein DppD [Helicobacter suis]BCD70502.1 Dipeptide ABC transporter, ATP-binding protein DppD [Helicobacter suis]BDR28145.1 ABC transporter ATP-binding protein [Helicobacter suis HS1]